MGMRRLFTLLVVLIALTFSYVAAGETEGRPDFATMRVKELQALLTERGVKCDGCAEKKDLVARVEETYDMPVVTATQTGAAPPSDEEVSGKARTKDEVLELLKGFKGANGQGFQVFDKGDMEKLRQKMEAKSGGGPEL